VWPRVQETPNLTTEVRKNFHINNLTNESSKSQRSLNTSTSADSTFFSQQKDQLNGSAANFPSIESEVNGFAKEASFKFLLNTLNSYFLVGKCTTVHFR
jgi:hypothetical protein